jgi:hypothetical protein
MSQAQEYQQVNIPPDYFWKMAVKDYKDWKLALVREFIQNSVDAGATEVRFNYTETEDGNILSVDDNGSGMTRDIIENSLLTLGGSHKSDDEAVGGLGKAKEILYFAWPNWHIHSNRNQVEGQGGTYRFTPVEVPKHGTYSAIKLDDRLTKEAIRSQLISYLRDCNLPNTTITFNGDVINDQSRGDKKILGRKVYHIPGLGDLYEADLYKGKVLVQAHGLFMFSNYTVLDKSYVFNITMPSYDCLTANRDGFVGDWQDKFTRMLGKIAVDSESSHLKQEYVLYIQPLKAQDATEEVEELVDKLRNSDVGEKMEVYFDKPKADLTMADVDKFFGDEIITFDAIVDKGTQEKVRSTINARRKTQRMERMIEWYRNHFPEGFIIVSDKELTNRNIKTLYQSKTMRELFLWKTILTDIAKQFGLKDFGFGIVTDSDTEAAYREGFFMINPFAFRDYKKTDKALKYVLAACHEIVHGWGHKYHNETFLLNFDSIVFNALRGKVKVRHYLKEMKGIQKKNNQEEDNYA